MTHTCVLTHQMNTVVTVHFLFCFLQVDEIDVLASTKDRKTFFIAGLTLGNEKCSVIRDNFNVDQEWSVDMRTKCAGGGPTYNIAMGKANTGKCCEVHDCHHRVPCTHSPE